MGDSRGCEKCCVLCQYFHFVVTVFGLFHCSPTSRDMLMLDVIEGCLGESNRSGWCSGYHARFTRERSRVQSSHPIFFSSFIFCFDSIHRIRFLSFFALFWMVSLPST